MRLWGLAILKYVGHILESLSCIPLFVTPSTVVCQAPLFMGFSQHEYRNGLPSPSPGDLPNPGTEPRSPILQADSLLSESPEKPCVGTGL